QLDGGEVMAELAEAERDVERGDVESEREQRVQRVKQSVQHGAPSRRRYHRDQPLDDAMAALAAVERLLQPASPGTEPLVQALAVAERPPRLDQQRGDDRAHARGLNLINKPAEEVVRV